MGQEGSGNVHINHRNRDLIHLDHDMIISARRADLFIYKPPDLLRFAHNNRKELTQNSAIKTNIYPVNDKMLTVHQHGL